MKSVIIGITIALALVADAQTAFARDLAAKKVTVAATNDEWTRTGVEAKHGDVVLIVANGQVKVGEFLGSTGPKGVDPTGEGALEAKVGTGAAFKVGNKDFVIIDEPGMVKLRVRDSKYTDNAGAFKVLVLLIPAERLPVPETVADED